MCYECDHIDDLGSNLTELEYVQNLLRDGIEAFRLTREYVGKRLLPEQEGWSWYDWTQRVRDYFGE